MRIVTQLKPFEVQNAEGKIILSMPLMDLHFLQGNILATLPPQEANEDGSYPMLDQEYKLTAVAKELSKRSTEPISWGVAAQITNAVAAAVEEIKKNGQITPDPASLIPCPTKPKKTTSRKRSSKKGSK